MLLTDAQYHIYYEAARLREKYGHWGEHPDHPLVDWQDDAADGSTRQGYWEWCANREQE